MLPRVRDLAVPIEDEDALRPGGVKIVHGVVNRVHDARHGQIQPSATGLGHRLALTPVLGLVKNDVVSFVRLHLPAVGWVSLLNVHKEKRGAVLVFSEQRFEVARLATERRSGEAAENEHERAARLMDAAGDALRAVAHGKGEIRGRLTGDRNRA